MHGIDYLIIFAYFVPVIYIGLRAKRSVHSSQDFFLSGRSLPPLITGVAFVIANMGSFELMSPWATGAKYGMFAFHMTWIGFVLAMFLSGLVMAPVFYDSE